MTNFRYSQNPRVARKRPSRASRTATRRKVSDDRYRGQSEIRRSARGNKRANHKRSRDPREIGLTSFEPMPYGYERWNGSVWLDSWVDQYNSELERIETRFNDGYDVTHLVNGLYNLADTFDYNAKTSHRANRRRSHTSHRASRGASRRRPRYAQHRAKRKRAMSDYDVQTAADIIFESQFDSSQDMFDDIYETDTHLVYEAIERDLDERGYEYDDYDVTAIASFIAGGNSDW